MLKNIDLQILNIIYFVILPIIGLIAGYNFGRYRRWAESNSGEALVMQLLKAYCKDNKAHVLNCVTLKLEDGSTTQIDHILICTKGIFVIETKHYSGWIFGNPFSKVWTQVIFKNRYKFQNPLFQNYKHVKVIQGILEFIKPHCIHNIVVFSGNSQFITEKINNVCYIEELIDKLNNYPEDVLSLNHLQFCVGRIEYVRLKISQKTDLEHNEHLMQKFGR